MCKTEMCMGTQVQSSISSVHSIPLFAGPSSKLLQRAAAYLPIHNPPGEVRTDVHTAVRTKWQFLSRSNDPLKARDRYHSMLLAADGRMCTRFHPRNFQLSLPDEIEWRTGVYTVMRRPSHQGG
jgi:hypothetical protein